LSSDPQTIHGSILAAAAVHPQRTALRYRDGRTYVPVTYDELVRSVAVAAERLRAFGLKKGDAVGIYCPNRPQWIVADLAVLSLGGIVVPVYHTLPVSQLGYIINDSHMRMLFVGDASLFEGIAGVRSEAPDLEEVIFLDDWGVRFGQSTGGAAGPGPSVPRDEVEASDVATVVYTSGTTGEPKGVMLTHGNIVSNARALIERFGITPEDSTVSYLPIAHMFERTCGHYTFLFAGATVAYAEKRETVVEDVKAIKPTVLIAVPRVLEKAYETARAKVESGPLVRKGLVHRTVALLNERANRRYQGRPVPLWLEMRCRVYDALAASQFRAIAGGRLRLIVSGGAALDRQVGKILKVLGFGIIEGYGLTETSPVVSVGGSDDHRLGTVGRPLDGVEVAISDEGEIFVRGPNVMKGYLNKPRETSAVLDQDGWLHTGDLGRVEDDGNVVVTGRIKDIIITSYGKNIAPIPVEERIARSPYIEQAVIFGERRKSLVALVVPNREEIERYALEHDVRWDAYDVLLEHYEIRELLEGEIEQANGESASYERVTEFGLLAEPFGLENAMLTPSLKLRRGVIAETYAARIEALYQELERKHAP